MIFFWLCDGLGEKDMMKLEQDLTLPPAGAEIKKDDPIWSADAEMAAFRSQKK